MRFKPPPPNSDIGWRVEFRPCELQISDYENAAVACFVVLLTRVILSYGYNLLVPISKIDENMKRAQKMDAIVKEKFFFRTNITFTCDATEENEQQAIIEGTSNLDMEIQYCYFWSTVMFSQQNVHICQKTLLPQFLFYLTLGDLSYLGQKWSILEFQFLCLVRL